MPNENTDIIQKVVGNSGELAIPDPIQKGLFKAANRLLGGLLDVGEAYLEGFTEDRRATTEARKLMRIEAAKSMAEGFKSDSPIANRAYAIHASKILGQQVNIEDILGEAIEDVVKNGKNAKGGEITEDWFNAFEAEACQKSSEEMKTVFSRVLSGEIQSPGTFSLATIRVLGTMGPNLADSFQKLCSLATSVQNTDIRVLEVEGRVGQNNLSRFGFSYNQILLLQEAGLLSFDISSTMAYDKIIPLVPEFNYAGMKYSLKKAAEPNRDFKANGVALSKVGREIYTLVDLTENKEYTKALEKYFKNNKFDMVLSRP